MESKLASLEVELLSAILEYVVDDSPHTIKAVLLVNKHFHATALNLSHRRKSLVLDENTEGCNALMSKWLSNAEILLNVRHLTIQGRLRIIEHFPRDENGESEEDDEDVTTAFKLLAQIIRKIARLRTLAWEIATPVPLIVLDALHQFQQKAQLKIYDLSRRSCDVDHNDPAELALASSPALTVLKAKVWSFGGGTAFDLRQANFRRIIANAPNLKFASITRGRSGCVTRWLSPEHREAEKEKEQAFYTHKCPNTALKALTLDGYPASEETIDEWSNFVDFSKLESLKLSRGGFADKSYFNTAARLTNLKHVSLNFRSRPPFGFKTQPENAAAADNYLATCPPLETISLWGWMDVVSLSTILKHGPTLRHLQLHESESTTLGLARGLLSVEEIEKIRMACPHLEEFTMDLNREEENWEDEVENSKIYAELARFGAQLNSLQLYFDLGVAARSGYALNGHQDTQQVTFVPHRALGRDSTTGSDSFITEDPELNEKDLRQQEIRRRQQLRPLNQESSTALAKSIWQIVFADKTRGPRTLHLKIGEWERKMGMGYPAPWVLWEQSNRLYLTATPHERDDRPGEVVVSCLRGHMN